MTPAALLDFAQAYLPMPQAQQEVNIEALRQVAGLMVGDHIPVIEAAVIAERAGLGLYLTRHGTAVLCRTQPTGATRLHIRVTSPTSARLHVEES